jgi:hypothetical protein
LHKNRHVCLSSWFFLMILWLFEWRPSCTNSIHHRLLHSPMVMIFPQKWPKESSPLTVYVVASEILYKARYIMKYPCRPDLAIMVSLHLCSVWCIYFLKCWIVINSLDFENNREDLIKKSNIRPMRSHMYRLVVLNGDI